VSDDRLTERRQLLLLRHAKSSWDNALLDDHERPLAPRGSKALGLVADRLRSWDVHPDLVLCSSARRAVDTWHGISDALTPDTPVLVEDGLYGAGAGALLSRIAAVEADVRCLLLIGHNPGLEDLAVRLAGTGKPSLRDELAHKFPTAALALLTFADEWGELDAGTATLEELFKPRKGH
jgi:phosphohistidine phosphatase